MLVEEKYEMPFPLSTRQGDMYLNLFNNIEVNNKLLFTVKSYDCDKSQFWIPPHIQKIGDDYLRKNADLIKKRRTVKIEADFLIGEIEFHNDETFTLTAYSHFNPKSTLSVPEVFEKMFGRTFVNGWYNNLNQYMGQTSKQGYKGTGYEKVIKNMKKNENLAGYNQLQKDFA